MVPISWAPFFPCASLPIAVSARICSFLFTPKAFLEKQMSLQLDFSCDLEPVARSFGRGWGISAQHSCAYQLEQFLDCLDFNHSMPVGPGDDLNLICDLIHISHEWELALQRISSSFWVLSLCIELFFWVHWDLMIKIGSPKGTLTLRDWKRWYCLAVGKVYETLAFGNQEHGDIMTGEHIL